MLYYKQSQRGTAWHTLLVVLKSCDRRVQLGVKEKLEHHFNELGIFDMTEHSVVQSPLLTKMNPEELLHMISLKNCTINIQPLRTQDICSCIK